MKAKHIFAVSIVITCAASLYAFRGQIFKNDFRLESVSPRGTYHVIFDGRTEPAGEKLHSENVELKVLKGQALFFFDEHFFSQDALDPHFREAYPVIGWVNDSALRLGDQSSGQPFQDEITVSNAAKEKFDVVVISYGRYERFILFDLGPGENLKLAASPKFGPRFPAAYIVGYQAYNLSSGSKTEGYVEGLKRKDISDGPLNLQVEIPASAASPSAPL